MEDGRTSGKFTITYNANLDGINSRTGQPYIWTPLTIGQNAATDKFKKAVADKLKETNNTGSIATGIPDYTVSWNVLKATGEVLAPTLPADSDDNYVVDVTNGRQALREPRSSTREPSTKATR